MNIQFGQVSNVRSVLLLYFAFFLSCTWFKWAITALSTGILFQDCSHGMRPWLESLKPKKSFTFHNWDGWPGGGRKQSRSSTEVLRHWTSSVWRLLCQKRRGEGWCTTPRGWANFRFCWVVEFSRLSTTHKKTKQMVPTFPHFFFSDS